MLDHKDLLVWQKARILVKDVYMLTKGFPQDECYGLTSQIRRAVVSIPSNIAEGYNRHSDKELVHFLKIAKGSAAELETQIILAMDLCYPEAEAAKRVLAQTEEILRLLGSFILSKEKTRAVGRG